MVRAAVAAAAVLVAGGAVWWLGRPRPAPEADLRLEFVRGADGLRVVRGLPPLPPEGVWTLRNGRIRYVDEAWGLDVELERVAGTIRPAAEGEEGYAFDLAGGVVGRPGEWRAVRRPRSIELAVRNVPLSALKAGAGDTVWHLDLAAAWPESGSLRLDLEAYAGPVVAPAVWAKTHLVGSNGVCGGGLAFKARVEALAGLLPLPPGFTGRIDYQGLWNGSPVENPRAYGRWNTTFLDGPGGFVEDVVSDTCSVDSGGIRFAGGTARTPAGRLADLEIVFRWADPAAWEASARDAEGEPLDRAEVARRLFGVH